MRKKAEEILGMLGMLISMSKSGYRDRNPDNLVVFNSNVCTETEKIWFGDLDITRSKAKLQMLAQELNETIFVLYEMDGRFDHENSPLTDKYVVKFNPDKTYEVAESIKMYYTL